MIEVLLNTITYKIKIKKEVVKDKRRRSEKQVSEVRIISLVDIFYHADYLYITT